MELEELQLSAFERIHLIEEEVNRVEEEWSELDKTIDYEEFSRWFDMLQPPTTVAVVADTVDDDDDDRNDNDTTWLETNETLPSSPLQPPSPSPQLPRRRANLSQLVAVIEFTDPLDNRRAAFYGASKHRVRQVERENRRRRGNRTLYRSSWYFVTSSTVVGLNRSIQRVQKRWRSARPFVLYEIERCRPIQLHRVTRRIFDQHYQEQIADERSFVRVCDRACLTCLMHDDQMEPPSAPLVMYLFETMLRLSGLRIYRIHQLTSTAVVVAQPCSRTARLSSGESVCRNQ